MNNWDSVIPSIEISPRQYATQREGKITYGQIARELSKLGVKASKDSVRGMLRRQSGKKPTVKKSKESIQGKTWNIALERTSIGTLEELVAEYKIDLTQWEIVSFSVSRSEVVHGTKSTGEGHEWSRESDDWTVEPLNHIKATFKKKESDSSFVRNEVASLKEQAKEWANKKPVFKKRTTPTGNMLELCLADHHFGKIAWNQQTGYEDYDVKIAAQIFKEAVSQLISRTSPYEFDKVLFVVGNDVFNTDNTENTTFAGTAVDSDTRYHRTFKMVREIIVDTIEELRYIAPVDVMVLPGNHDRMTAWHLGDSLECYFHGYKDVEIDNNPLPRKYRQWGNVMLAFAHGDKIKRDKLHNLIASEQPRMWGSSIFREVHTGDKHQVRVEESFGVRIRILPSLTGTDAWHSENGFVGNLRQSEAFVWNADDGLLGTAIYTHK